MNLRRLWNFIRGALVETGLEPATELSSRAVFERCPSLEERQRAARRRLMELGLHVDKPHLRIVGGREVTIRGLTERVSDEFAAVMRQHRLIEPQPDFGERPLRLPDADSELDR